MCTGPTITNKTGIRCGVSRIEDLVLFSTAEARRPAFAETASADAAQRKRGEEFYLLGEPLAALLLSAK